MLGVSFRYEGLVTHRWVLCWLISVIAAFGQFILSSSPDTWRAAEKEGTAEPKLDKRSEAKDMMPHLSNGLTHRIALKTELLLYSQVPGGEHRSTKTTGTSVPQTLCSIWSMWSIFEPSLCFYASPGSVLFSCVWHKFT